MMVETARGVVRRTEGGAIPVQKLVVWIGRVNRCAATFAQAGNAEKRDSRVQFGRLTTLSGMHRFG